MKITDVARARARVPREVDSDYTHAMAAKRRELVREQTGPRLHLEFGGWVSSDERLGRNRP